jgi:aspartate ammonia-lyase
MANQRGARTRLEKDSMGTVAVPAAALYGAQTRRAMDNFPISGLRSPRSLIRALAQVKRAAAEANAALGLLDRRRARAIVRACREVEAGRWADQFPVDIFQMGAGTSVHMNVNEVLANRAEELLGGRRGRYALVHPNDHVNLGQSTNDVYPTAIRLAALALINNRLRPELERFRRSLLKKARRFDRVIKSGRTHLQDAVPIRLGQEFAAYAAAVGRGTTALEQAARGLRELGIGGSAVGTGLNTHPRYAGLVVRELSASTGIRLIRASDLREAMQSLAPLAAVSSALKNLALELGRIANDLRLLASGPRTGLAEVILPAVAPGSSIMPGKVNPSMLEMLNQVIGCDLAVGSAAQAGQLELNVMMPVVAANLLFMITILANALSAVRVRAIDGLRADSRRCRDYAEASLGLATVLSPVIGYNAAAEVASESARTGRTILEIVRERRLLGPGKLERTLDPAVMTRPGIPARRVRGGARPSRPRKGTKPPRLSSSAPGGRKR